VLTSIQLQNSLKLLSLTSKRLRALCVPYLFNRFNLVSNENDPWNKAMEKLKGWNPEFARHVRYADSLLHTLSYWIVAQRYKRFYSPLV